MKQYKIFIFAGIVLKLSLKIVTLRRYSRSGPWARNMQPPYLYSSQCPLSAPIIHKVRTPAEISSNRYFAPLAQLVSSMKS